jgi:hypothetical protein
VPSLDGRLRRTPVHSLREAPVLHPVKTVLTTMIIYSSRQDNNYKTENEPIVYIAWDEPTEITEYWTVDP